MGETPIQKCNFNKVAHVKKTFKEDFWGTASEKHNFFNYLNKVQVTLMIETNVKLVKLSWLTSKFEN